jgi:hypothetical protein
MESACGEGEDEVQHVDICQGCAKLRTSQISESNSNSYSRCLVAFTTCPPDSTSFLYS